MSKRVTTTAANTAKAAFREGVARAYRAGVSVQTMRDILHEESPAERFRQTIESAGCVLEGDVPADMTAADVINAAESLLEQVKQFEQGRA